MEFYLQSLFGLHVHSCTRWLRPRNPAFGLLYEGAIGQPKYRSLCDPLATMNLKWVSKCSFSCVPRATSTVHSEQLEENPLWPSDRECFRRICMGGGGETRWRISPGNTRGQNFVLGKNILTNMQETLQKGHKYIISWATKKSRYNIDRKCYFLYCGLCCSLHRCSNVKLSCIACLHVHLVSTI